VVIEAVTDPEVPPLPPHIRFEQAREMAISMAKGDPNRGHIIRQTLRAKFADFVNR
jgi:pyruvate dehydrogenase (quinone)